jgi:Cu-Zn family superoxide dismutase
MRCLTVLAALLTVTGCARITQPATARNTASAELRTATGQPAGTATFTQVGGTIRIVLEAKGLPRGPHGVHIHEVGKCEAPKFDSAGNHFNPDKKQHGSLNPQGPHAGDLPNLTIGTDGTGRLETATDRITLGGGTNSIVDGDGSALVVHAAPDDFTTDPTGNSGDRIACGVIVKK